MNGTNNCDIKPLLSANVRHLTPETLGVAAYNDLNFIHATISVDLTPIPKNRKFVRL